MCFSPELVIGDTNHGVAPTTKSVRIQHEPNNSASLFFVYDFKTTFEHFLLYTLVISLLR